MNKTQIFPNVRLTPEAIAKLDKQVTGPEGIFSHSCLTELKLTMPDRISWQFDQFDPFIVEYPRSLFASYRRVNDGYEVLVENFMDKHHGPGTHIFVRAHDKATIERIFAIIEEYLPQSTNLEATPERCRRPRRRTLVN